MDNNNNTIIMTDAATVDTKDAAEGTIPAPKIPSPPFAYLSNQAAFLDLSQLEATLSENSEQRQQAYDLGNRIKAALLKCRASLEQHQTCEQKKASQDDLDALVKQALEFHRQQQKKGPPEGDDAEKPANKNSVRMGNLNNHFADYIRHRSYQHFIRTGTLLSPPPGSSDSEREEKEGDGGSLSSAAASSDFSDEEYLLGVLSFVNFDLKRYVLGRGTRRDAHSVLLARDMVSTLLDYLLRYDFRNGPLRRKYDGVKYTLKTCETVLYELSVTGSQEAMESRAAGARTSNTTNKRSNNKGGEPPSKRSKPNGGKTNDNSSTAPEDLIPSPFMDVWAMEALRVRIMEKDEVREKLIKKCRDGQKAAKQAIYALHRDDFDGAAALLHNCEQCILEELEPIVKLEPQLRHGSYANVLEEYAEAKLFQAWLVGEEEDSMQQGEDEDGSNNNGAVTSHGNSPAKVVLAYGDFSKIRLEPQEYLGGLCDLTGEIGRFAVRKATIRDRENVMNCLETNIAVLYAMESLGKVPGSIGKKIDPLRRTVEKQERMLYELSLVEATGRNTIVAGVVEPKVVFE